MPRQGRIQDFQKGGLVHGDEMCLGRPISPGRALEMLFLSLDPCQNGTRTLKSGPVETGLTGPAATALVNPMFRILGGNLASIHLFIHTYFTFINCL